MNAKRRLSILTNAAAVVLLAAANAHAASTSKIFVSKLAVAIFLGFCALLLVVQLIPAIMTLYGMLKGASKQRDTEEAKVKIH